MLFGVDNTFLSRAQKAGVFLDYQAPALPQTSPSRPRGHPDRHRCRVSELRPGVLRRPACPTGPADLVEPQYRDLTVVQNPATSSPGLAFLLSTVSAQPDWQQYWRDLKDNGVKVVDGWDNAYYQQFSGGSGEGTRPIVVSIPRAPRPKSCSPKTRRRRRPRPTSMRTASSRSSTPGCSLVRATKREPSSSWTSCSRSFQDDIGSQMFVYPVVEGATVPKAFEEYAPEPTDPVVMDPEQIADGRDEWIDQWSAIME